MKWRVTVGTDGVMVQTVTVDEADLFNRVQAFMLKYAKELQRKKYRITLTVEG